jgi:hypothetical protein
MPASVAGYLKLNCEVSFLKLDQSKLARVSKSCFKMFQHFSTPNSYKTLKINPKDPRNPLGTLGS